MSLQSAGIAVRRREGKMIEGILAFILMGIGGLSFVVSASSPELKAKNRWTRIGVFAIVLGIAWSVMLYKGLI